ncbi:MAG: alpha/beta fold hydrolase [Anaerolineae bacterium]
MLYRNVPQEQKDRLLQFRATHPYRRAVVDGYTWHYMACGQGGQTLVLLPGASRQAEATFVLISLLEEDYRLIVPSYPPVRTMDELADGVAAILEAEGVARARSGKRVWGSPLPCVSPEMMLWPASRTAWISSSTMGALRYPGLARPSF